MAGILTYSLFFRVIKGAYSIGDCSRFPWNSLFITFRKNGKSEPKQVQNYN